MREGKRMRMILTIVQSPFLNYCVLTALMQSTNNDGNDNNSGDNDDHVRF